MSKWHRDGIPLWSADRIAVTLGFHPVDVWPDWYAVTEGHPAAA